MSPDWKYAYYDATERCKGRDDPADLRTFWNVRNSQEADRCSKLSFVNENEISAQKCTHESSTVDYKKIDQALNK